MAESSRWGPNAPTRPRLVASGRHLGDEVDVLWPDRPRESDGWIGDASHAQRDSDHNPDPNGLVHALDITAAGNIGLLVVAAAVRHPAAAYVIFNGHIWSARNHWMPRRYDGPDPHRSHVHVSILHTTLAARSSRRWLPSSLHA